jgi:RNA polymerase sigma-70 factor (ECF subfamily)
MQAPANSADSQRGADPPAVTSTTLIERLKAGEAEAWRQVMVLYHPLVMWWCLRKGLGPHEAEDVAQEVFLTVARKAAEFTKREQGSSFRPWLKRITQHKVGDLIRKKRQQPRAVGGSDANEALEQVADPGPDDPAGEDKDAAADGVSEGGILARSHLERLRAEFEPRTWEMVTRVVIEGQRPADVAADLGVSVNSVYAAKAKVLARLRQALRDFE